MKRFFIFFSLLFLVFACKDEELAPLVTFDNVGKGAVIQLVDETPRVYDLANFDGASYNYTVQFKDINDGQGVTDYELLVRFRDNTPDNGDSSKDFAEFTSFTQGDFKQNENGLPSVDVTLPLSAVASTLGLTEADISAGDQFLFDGRISTDEGLTFSAANSSATVNSSAFAAHFNFTVSVACPVSDDFMVGSYTVTYEENGSTPFGGPVMQAGPFEVTLSVVSTTKRQFTAVYAEDLGFGTTVDFEFELLCDKVQPASGMGTGLGCGGTITFGPADEFGSFDLTDDSEIIIPFNELEDDGGCGSDPIKHVIKLTKN